MSLTEWPVVTVKGDRLSSDSVSCRVFYINLKCVQIKCDRHVTERIKSCFYLEFNLKCPSKHDLCFSPSIIGVMKSRGMRLAGNMILRGERRGAYRVLVGKPEGKRAFERRRRRWKDNMKVGFQEMGWGRGMD